VTTISYWVNPGEIPMFDDSIPIRKVIVIFRVRTRKPGPWWTLWLCASEIGDIRDGDPPPKKKDGRLFKQIVNCFKL
jgi:hypothetical protein